MSERRRGLGRGLGALIPDSGSAGVRPVDVFFPGAPESAAAAPARDADGGGPPMDAAAGVDQGVTSAEAPVGSEPAGVDPTSPVPSDLAPVPGATYAEIPVDAIRPNPRQPRTVFDEDDMAELVHSIREIGVLQPVVVRRISAGSSGDPADASYELVMGERRWRASRKAGKETVPAIVKETEDDALLRDALLENLHRSQLNALEEAAAYQQLLDDFGCTQEELATRIGRSRPQVSNTLRLLRLPPLVARRVAAGVLSAGHARALLTLDDGAAQERLAQRIVAEGLSVRTVEEIVALGVEPQRAPRAGRAPAVDRPQLLEMADRVSDRLDTRAKITMGQRKGRLTIEFASLDDLERILGEIGVPAGE